MRIRVVIIVFVIESSECVTLGQKLKLFSHKFSFSTLPQNIFLYTNLTAEGSCFDRTGRLRIAISWTATKRHEETELTR